MNAIVQLNEDPEVAMLVLEDGRGFAVCTSPASLEKLLADIDKPAPAPAGAGDLPPIVLVCSADSRAFLDVPPLLGKIAPERVICSEDVWEICHRSTSVTLYPRTCAVGLAAKLGATQIQVMGDEREISDSEEVVLANVARALPGVAIEYLNEEPEPAPVEAAVMPPEAAPTPAA